MNEQEKRDPATAPNLRRLGGLEASFLATILGYLAFEIAVFVALSLSNGFFARYGAAFLATTLGFHGFLLGVLFWFKADFYIEPSGERLRRVNLANAITLFRISALPTILFLVFAAKDYGIKTPLLAFVVVVFLTDFADGFVSRRGKQITKVGRMLDSASDYLLLIVLSAAFYYFFLIPAWLFAVVIGRFALQSILMFILIGVNRRLDPKTSFLGKMAVATVMILFACEILEIVVGPAAKTALTVLEGIAAAILAVSAFEKLLIFARELRVALRGRAST